MNNVTGQHSLCIVNVKKAVYPVVRLGVVRSPQSMESSSSTQCLSDSFKDRTSLGLTPLIIRLLARSTFYQQQARRYQGREVRAKTYNIGELVLRLPEKKKDKLKPKWEGPFIIDKVLTGGAYRLHDASDNRLEPNPWNAARLRRFYA